MKSYLVSLREFLLLVFYLLVSGFFARLVKFFKKLKILRYIV